MDIVEHSKDWIEFDAETDEVPFLHMHDMVEVKHKDYNSHWKLVPVPAWSVDFDTSRNPVVAYRVVKKADVNEIEQLRDALSEAIEFADQDYHALTPTGETMISRWRSALQQKETE